MQDEQNIRHILPPPTTSHTLVAPLPRRLARLSNQLPLRPGLEINPIHQR